MTSKLLIGGLAVAVAFLVATNPVVVHAAGQITGKQIKNSSLKGKDIKDDSLTGKDVAESSLSTVPSAGNATTLEGQPAGSYRNPAYRFTLPVQTSTLSRSYNLAGVPPGTYLASFSVLAFMDTSTDSLYCTLKPSATAALSLGGAYGETRNGVSTSTGSALLDVGATPPQVYCVTAGGTNYSIYSAVSSPSTVSLVKVDSATTGGVTVSRPAGGRPPVTLR